MTKRALFLIGLLIAFGIIFILFGHCAIGATEPILAKTRTAKILSPTTIDYAGITILNWPIPGGVGSVFGRTGAVVAQGGDYVSFYAPVAAGVPTGGTSGQVLTKNSSTDYAM